MVVGGANSAYLSTVELYDPVTKVWSPLGMMSVARQGGAATLLQDLRVLIVGGGDGGSYLASAELYEPEGLSFCSPHAAQAMAILYNGELVGLRLVDYGCGYTNAPLVQIVGGGGTGATALAKMTNGVVTGLVITSAGSGYTNAPRILIESPPFVPTVSIAVSKVKVTQKVRVNHNYVLEASLDLATWAATGPAFTAESESIVNEFDVDAFGRFFRLREVP